MTSEPLIIPGIVKNGIVIPEGHATLPEGARVGIVLRAGGVPSELRVEFDAWEGASDEAWAMIDEWERKERS